MADKKPNDCCNEAGNLVVITAKEAEVQDPPEGVVISRCKVCRCRHFEMEVDPIPVNSQFS